MTRALASAAVAAALTLFSTSATAQDRDRSSDENDFTWSGKLPRGAWLRVHTVKGRVKVEPGTSDMAEVIGRKRSRRGDSEEISFEVSKDGQSVTICALFLDHGTCDSEGIRSDRSSWHRGHEMDADFTVRLPKGVNIAAISGNGEVDVNDAGADVEARSGNGRVTVTNANGSVKANSGNGSVTVADAGGPVEARSGNGRVRVETATGPVTATSGNGDIDVRMSALSSDDDMDFETGNGSVTVTVPDGFEGEVDTNTGNGKFSTDFPITVRGRLDSRHVRGTIGKGGRRVRMTSGNGNLELRKRD